MRGRSQPLMSADASESAWYVICRWRQYVAEQRVNVLRICTIALFYLVHLLRYQAGAGTSWLGFLQEGGAGGISFQRHLAITVVVAGWVLWSLTVHVLLLDRVFSAASAIGLDLPRLCFSDGSAGVQFGSCQSPGVWLFFDCDDGGAAFESGVGASSGRLFTGRLFDTAGLQSLADGNAAGRPVASYSTLSSDRGGAGNRVFRCDCGADCPACATDG